ncbi:hypothetical protein O3M35_004027 [Rhynocoris fuscipes]|uniref:Uncharacterized protein n=1 Tax=Rhynocoris fuscipes TaxID=488301 RepID=A0AAW1CKX1_9HEMI
MLSIQKRNQWFKEVAKVEKAFNCTYQRIINRERFTLMLGVKMWTPVVAEIMKIIEEQWRELFWEKRAKNYGPAQNDSHSNLICSLKWSRWLGFLLHELRKEEMIFCKRQMGGGSVVIGYNHSTDIVSNSKQLIFCKRQMGGGSVVIGYNHSTDIVSNSKQLIFCKRQMGSGSVVIGYNHSTDIVSNSKQYLSLIEYQLKRYFERVRNENVLFQEDNAPVNTAKNGKRVL